MSKALSLPLKVHSIFESISGEAGVFPQGVWSTFIRLQGCNLSCRWCDTSAAQPFVTDNMRIMDPSDIVLNCRRKNVIITGGEPLTQDVSSLIKYLLADGHTVQVETNGSFSNIPFWFGHRHKYGLVIDYKCPSSGMQRKMMSVSQFADKLLHMSAVVKFVVATESDIEFAIARIREIELERQMLSMDEDSESYALGDTGDRRWRYIFSPLSADAELARRMIDCIESLDAGMLDISVISFQLHKILRWP